MPSEIENFLADIQSLPPAAQAQLKQKFFQKYVMPSDEWQSGGLSGRIELTKQLGIPDVAGGPEIKSAPGVGSRILGRAGGLPSSEQWRESPGMAGLGAASSVLNLPGAALGEAVDAATGRRPASFGWEMSSPGEAAHGLANLAMAAPKGAIGGAPLWRQIVQSPGMLRRLINVLNDRIAANYAGALTDIPKPMSAGRPPLMLPPAGSSTRVPFPMAPTPAPAGPPPRALTPPATWSPGPQWAKPAPSIEELLKPPGPID
jgi:hypothetical protein